MKRLLVCIALLWAPPALAQTPIIGFESGPSAVIATPSSASHAAGTAVGAGTATGAVANVTSVSGQITNQAQQGTLQSGLFVIPVARVPGASMIVTQVAMTSTGGSTGQYVLRAWRKWPQNTTCQDNVAFAGNFNDDAELITPPFSITPAAPAVTTGDANTYGSVTVQTYDFENTDQPPTRNIYICLQTVSTDTADEAKAIRIMVSGPQN
jgi:hypothetical protein